jgi:hypothetical protein
MLGVANAVAEARLTLQDAAESEHSLPETGDVPGVKQPVSIKGYGELPVTEISASGLVGSLLKIFRV